jgi:hypothetical protein
MLRRIPKCFCSWRSWQLRGQHRPAFGRSYMQLLPLGRQQLLPQVGCHFDQNLAVRQYELQGNLRLIFIACGHGSRAASTMDAKQFLILRRS